MPGVSISNLDLCRGNLDELEAACRMVADRLLWGKELVLETRDRNGGKRRLRVPIGIYRPKTSTGRVPLQGWCNVPSGETFVVPNEWESEGEVVINGSLPNYLFYPDEEVVLRVKGGRVQHPVECRGRGVLRVIRQLVFKAQGQEVCTNCAALAEVGIGLNPLVTRYTGLPIFDEKKAGTVHVALGSNNQFGGSIVCDMHNDLVIERPSLFVDETAVIRDGRVCLEQDMVFPNWKIVTPRHFDPDRPFSRTGVVWRERRKPGRILANRTWISDRTEGETWTQIGDDETAVIATNVLWAVENLKLKTVSQIKGSVTDCIPHGSVEPVLELLVRFGLIHQG
jgi:hypothetical protein